MSKRRIISTGVPRLDKIIDTAAVRSGTWKGNSWSKAYSEYLRGHNGHGDPLSYDEFRDRLDTHGKLRPDSDPKTTKPKPPVVREAEPHTSDDPPDYDLNDEGATGALIPANSKKKTPFANPHYATRTDKPLAGRNQGKAEREGVYRPGNVGKIEDYRAQGHTKVAGKHVTADGLVSRKGYRRVPPAWLLADSMERDWQVEEYRRLAESALRGRNRKIFIKNIIEPLEGLPGATYRELAEQYGESPATIFRIIGKCQMKIADALEAGKKKAAKTKEHEPPYGSPLSYWNTGPRWVLGAIRAEREEPGWFFVGSSQYHHFYRI